MPADATPDGVAALAGAVLPTPRKLAWQATGLHALVHFGMDTFPDRERGDGMEPPETLAPTGFDAEQRASTFRAAWMRGVVLTGEPSDDRARRRELAVLRRRGQRRGRG